jgi:probable HAF family extracellular repeat protein
LRKIHIISLLTLIINNHLVAEGFEDLGTLGGSVSAATGISKDGSVVFGYSFTPGDNSVQAFKFNNGVMTSIGTLGGTNSYAYGSSGDGSVIIGTSDLSGDAQSHAFSYTNNSLMSLGTLGGQNSNAYAISVNGLVIVGDSLLANGDNHAYKYSSGIMTDLGTLGGANSSATAVSTDGSVIVGSSHISNINETWNAFKIVNGVMTNLGTLGGLESYATGVSGDGNQIIGHSNPLNSSYFNAFIYTQGAMTNIGTLGGQESYAKAISNNGKVIVGYSTTAAEDGYKAFRYSNGSMINLGTLGGSESFATGVNHNGSVIVGYSMLEGDANIHAFIYRNRMVDLNNTLNSLDSTSKQFQSLANIRSHHINTALSTDCKLFAINNVCISMGASQISDFGADKQISLMSFRAAYRPISNLRIGGFVDDPNSNFDFNNIKHINNSPLFGMFAVWNQNDNEIGTQLRFSYATNSQKARISRSILDFTEAGVGVSKLSSVGAIIELSYRSQSSEKSFIEPYVAIRETRFTVDEYSENNLIDFPISYEKVRVNTRTGLMGLRYQYQSSDSLNSYISFGVERDLTRKVDHLAGDIASLAGFAIPMNGFNFDRKFLKAGAILSITPTTSFSLEANISENQFNKSLISSLRTYISFGF